MPEINDPTTVVLTSGGSKDVWGGGAWHPLSLFSIFTPMPNCDVGLHSVREYIMQCK